MWTDNVLCMKVHSLTTMVTSVYEIILMLAGNVCIKSSSGSVLELVVANTQSWSPICNLIC